MKTIIRRYDSTNRVATMPPEYYWFVKHLKTTDNKELKRKISRYSQSPILRQHPEQIADRIMTEIGGEMNRLTRQEGSHKAAINMAANKYGLDKALLQKLFYDVGSPFQYIGAQFEMEKTKDSQALKLRLRLQDLQKENVPWEEAKQQLLQSLTKARVKPEDKATITQGLKEANSYDKADGTLIKMHLKYIQMGANPDQRKSHLVVSYLIPWYQKTWVTKAQRAASQYAFINLKGTTRGLRVRGEHKALHKAGLTLPLTKMKDRTAALRFARTAPILDQLILLHPSGERTAELLVEAGPKEATRIAKSLVEAGYDQILIFDQAGRPHKVTRV